MLLEEWNDLGERFSDRFGLVVEVVMRPALQLDQLPIFRGGRAAVDFHAIAIGAESATWRPPRLLISVEKCPLYR